MVRSKESLFKKGVIAVVVLIAALLFLLMAMPEETAFSADSSLQKLIYLIGLLTLTTVAVGTVWWHIFHTPAPGRQPKAYVIPLLSGLMALGILSLGYVLVGMWPVGKESCMIVDLHHQYGPLLAQLRDMLLHGGNVLYSFDTGLGLSFLPLFGYYLASPLNLLLVLFPENLLTEGVLVITLLKNALSAAFFAWMLQYIYRRRTVAITAVSVMYALMIYMLAYSWNIMWLDVVMVLPLAVLGLERLMRTGKFGAYIFAVAYMVYANYYIGFMACLFLLLYFIVYLLRTRRNSVQNAGATLRFFVGSALGGGLAMFLLLPVFFGLMQTSAAGGTMPDAAANFSMFDLIGRHLYGVTPTIRSGNLPNIACGMLAVVLLPIFATLKTIPVRRRAAYTGLWLLLAMSTVLKRMDLLWHGLHAPNDLPYRFSFLYCFALLLIAYETLLHIRDIRLPQIAFTGAGLAAYLIVEEKFGDGTYGFKPIYISLLLIGLYCLIAALVSRRVVRARVGYALLFCAVCAELTVGTGNTLVQLNRQEYYTDHASYVDNLTTRAVAETVEQTQQMAEETPFYRMEVLPRRTLVDGALFGYRGISIFSSSNYYQTTRLMNALGYASNGVNSFTYRAYVHPVDSLLGLRYLLFNKELTNNPYLQKIDYHTAVDLATGEEQTYYIYENKEALPLAFLTQPPTKEWQYSYYDPLYTQESLFAAMTGLSDGSLYFTAPIAVSENSANGSTNANVSPTYISLSSGSGTARFTATIEHDGQCYVYVDCRAARSASAVVIPEDGNTTSYSVSTNEPYMIDVGVRKAGESVQISLTSDIGCAGHLYVLTVNDEYWQQALTALRAGGLQVQEFTDSKITGTVNAAYSGVMLTTIPYDAGWQVRIDGKKTDCYAVSEALLAFDLPAGEHTVELTFCPKGLWIGLILSGISLIVVVLLLVLLRRRPGEDLTAEAPEDEPEETEAEAPAETAAAPAQATPEDASAALLADAVAELSGETPDEPATPADAIFDAPPADGADPDDFLHSFYIQDQRGVTDP